MHKALVYNTSALYLSKTAISYNLSVSKSVGEAITGGGKDSIHGQPHV
jgi:hypothetical protein